MQSAIVRAADVGHGRRLAASLMVAAALLIGALYNGVGVRLFADSKLAWLALAPAAGLVLWLAWTTLVPRRRDRQVLDLGHGLIAWVVATILIVYSIAKVFGGQFGPPMQSELDTPLRDLSGFQLTWRFFGYSYAYTLFIAGGQLGAAVLMCFGRTRLLGACLQAPIMTNIVVLNITHGIPVKLLSAILLALDLYLIAALGGRRLLAFALGEQVTPRPPGPTRWRIAGLKALVVVLYILYVGAAALASRQRWYQPSPVYGTWEVVDVRRSVSDWRRIYFENYRHSGKHIGSLRNRDGLVRFRYSAGADDHRIHITLPMKQLEGRFELGDRSLTIRGTLAGNPIELDLERVD